MAAALDAVSPNIGRLAAADQTRPHGRISLQIMEMRPGLPEEKNARRSLPGVRRIPFSTLGFPLLSNLLKLKSQHC